MKNMIRFVIALLLVLGTARVYAAEQASAGIDKNVLLSAAPADVQAFVAAFYKTDLGQDLAALDPDLIPRGWPVDLDGDGVNEWIFSEPLFSNAQAQTAMILGSGPDGWRVLYRETGPFPARIDEHKSGGYNDITAVYNIAAAPRGGYGSFRTLLAWNGQFYEETDPPLEYFKVVSDLPVIIHRIPDAAANSGFDLLDPGACVASTAEGDERFTEGGATWQTLNRPVPGYVAAHLLAPEPRCELAFAFARLVYESAAQRFASITPDKPFEPTDELRAWVRRRLADRVTQTWCNKSPMEQPREIVIHRVLDELPEALPRPFPDARSFFPYFVPAIPESPDKAAAIRFDRYFKDSIEPVTWIFTQAADSEKYKITRVEHGCAVHIEPSPEPEKSAGAEASARDDDDLLDTWRETYANPSDPQKGAANKEAEKQQDQDWEQAYPGYRAVVPDFLALLRAGDLAAAYAMLGDEIKAGTSFRDFEARYKGVTGLDASAPRVRRVVQNVFEAKFTLTMQEGSSSALYNAQVRYASIGGAWFITYLGLFKIDW